MSSNTLYYGDNLDILQRYIKDDSVDLIYLDPPFNSQANYNILFDDHAGGRSSAQIQAFKDTWSWDEASLTFQELSLDSSPMGDAIRSFGTLLKHGGMLAYLTMMAPRLRELHRVLKPIGSIYLHCDPTASHYLKILMDAIFGPKCYRTEIIWKRSSAHSDTAQGRKQHGRIHDVILYYARGDDWTWNPIYTPYDQEYVDDFYKYIEEGTGRRYRLGDITGPGGAAKGNPSYEVMGVTRYWRYSKEKMDELIKAGRIIQTKPGAVPAYKRYLDEMPGVPIQDIWTDINPIGAQATERLGYPTQKPEALLERIIKASSNEGNLVLDPFCGCGTATVVAQRLKRKWIGIDITQAAIVTIKKRLLDTFGDQAVYQVIGEPTVISDAEVLASENPYQFQWWALGLVGARPSVEKKGSDKGIDGRLFFKDDNGQPKQIIIQVKAGQTGVAHVHELRGVIERENVPIGVLIILHDPTKPMKADAGSAGYYESAWGKHPRIQILTIAQLLEGKGIDYPRTTGVNVTFKQAPKAKPKKEQQAEFNLQDNPT